MGSVGASRNSAGTGVLPPANQQNTSTTGGSDNDKLATFAALSDAEKNKFFNSQQYKNTDLTGLNRGSETQRLVTALDMNEKPTVLTDADFDATFKANALDGVYLFRGVTNNGRMQASAIVDSVKFGDKTFIGDGVHGDGIYFGTSYNYASSYANGRTSGMMQAYIDKSKARVIDEKDAQRLMRADTSGHRYSDISDFAIAKGYNVIRVPGGNNGTNYARSKGKASGYMDFYVPLTRSVLVIRDTVRRPSTRN